MTLLRSPKRINNTRQSTWRPKIESLEERIVLNADVPSPVLMVISNQDFW